MLEIRTWSEWFRRSYDGYADHRFPVTILDVFEDFHDQTGRLDWHVRFVYTDMPELEASTWLAGSFLALFTQTERPTA